ncbi:hypothetical protein R3P38DRAFT_2607120 [Favolaschia claudopus]|uniref:F-box domain-containing protein n=1 Tax=Favolaschia claudopus TaxID=2862362 RepID=A0AAW0D3C8_9AGAR
MPGSLFLQLPSELILACLETLPLTDLDSCANCNRLLHEIITKSVLLHYRREQARAGVGENPSVASNLVISDRLDKLHRRESNWLNFEPLSTHAIPIDFATTGLYDLTSDAYFVGDTADPNTRMCTAIKYIRTAPGETQWRTVDGGKPIIDFGTSLEEHDLIALVTYTIHDRNPLMSSVDISLLKFSTGAPHPLAAQPVLHVHDVEVVRHRPGISIEIVGDTLALSMVYWSFELRDMDVLYLFNWKLGTPCMDPVPVYNTGMIFLTEGMLVLPNSYDESLDVLYIPSDPVEEPLLLHSFHLPELMHDTSIRSFQCRGSPNPRTTTTSPSSASFVPRTWDALLMFSLQVGNHTTFSDHLLIVDRPRFFGAIQNAREENPEGVEWDDWGPDCCRWLNAQELSTQYITTTSGRRMVTIAHDAFERPAPITIMDFNPSSVRAHWHLGVVEREKATSRVVEASTQHLELFARPIASGLPYLEIVSKERFDYGAVLINDENVIGTRFGDATVASLDVLHFG